MLIFVLIAQLFGKCKDSAKWSELNGLKHDIQSKSRITVLLNAGIYKNLGISKVNTHVSCNPVWSSLI